MNKYSITYKINDGTEDVICNEFFAESVKDAVDNLKCKYGKSIFVLNVREVNDDGTFSTFTYYIDVPTMTPKEEREFVEKMTEELKKAIGL